MITGVVLAGGASSRFGGDKLAVKLDGRPVLHHAIMAVAAVADEIVLVLAPDASEPALPPALPVPVRYARDASPHLGPLAGLAAALACMDDVPAHVALVVGGDMPWLRSDVLRALARALESDEGADGLTLEAADVAPLPFVVRAAAARPVAAAAVADGRRSLRSLRDALRWTTLPSATWRRLDPAGLTLRDVDTPADLRGG